MKFSVMPHAKRDDRRIEATGNPYEDRGELRGPRRDAIEDNLPKGIEVGSLTIDAGPRGPNDRIFGPPFYNLQRHPRYELNDACKGGRPLRQTVDVYCPAQFAPVDRRLMADRKSTRLKSSP